MDRRELLQLLSASAALALLPRGEDLLAVGRGLHHAAPVPPLHPLDREHRDLISLIADRILPRTDTPGALDIEATAFIERLLSDWYPDDERARFLAGIAEIQARARRDHGGPLETLDETTQVGLLAALDGETGAPETAGGALARLKGLVTYAWLTSDRVRNEVTHSPVIPGRFDGCIPLERR